MRHVSGTVRFEKLALQPSCGLQDFDEDAKWPHESLPQEEQAGQTRKAHETRGISATSTNPALTAQGKRESTNMGA